MGATEGMTFDIDSIYQAVLAKQDGEELLQFHTFKATLEQVIEAGKKALHERSGAPADSILYRANLLAAEAAAAGLVVTIALDHQRPAAMGNYPMVASVRPARNPAFPDPAKMNFTPDTPDKYNASLRVDNDKPRRRRTD